MQLGIEYVVVNNHSGKTQIRGWEVQENKKCNLDNFLNLYFAILKNINKVTKNC